MIVYSKKIIKFVQEIKSVIKDVLSKEVGLKVTGNRFYDYRNRTSYPLKVVVFNNKKMLGYFDSNFYELGFNECLMHVKKEQLHHIIRHEVAHYITFINYGADILPHGVEFRTFCQKMQWGENIYNATFCLENESPQMVVNEEASVLRKVQKLMALATSSNQHEAEQAMIKSQQLLLKHNIDSKYIEDDEEKIGIKRIMKQKKENAKMRSIAKILETFLVNIVYTRTEEFTYLEILGNAVNIEIAEYVAAVLDVELDKLWKQAQKFTHLKGAIAKNSFFLGVAKGYCNKLEALKREYNNDIQQGLMVLEKKLMDAKSMVYPRLSSVKSRASHCHESSLLGQAMGRQLTINPGISQTAKNTGTSISYHK